MREEKEDKEKEEENYYDKSEDDDDDSDDRSHLFEYKDLAGNVQGPFPLTHLGSVESRRLFESRTGSSSFTFTFTFTS